MNRSFSSRILRTAPGALAALLVVAGTVGVPLAVSTATPAAAAPPATDTSGWSVATPQLATITGSGSSLAPWNTSQGDSGSTSYPQSDLLPTFVPGGPTTTLGGVTEPNVAVNAGSGTVPYGSGVVGTPGPLADYCGSGSNATEDAGAPSRQPSGTTLPMSPVLLPAHRAECGRLDDGLLRLAPEGRGRGHRGGTFHRQRQGLDVRGRGPGAELGLLPQRRHQRRRRGPPAGAHRRWHDVPVHLAAGSRRQRGRAAPGPRHQPDLHRSAVRSLRHREGGARRRCLRHGGGLGQPLDRQHHHRGRHQLERPRKRRRPGFARRAGARPLRGPDPDPDADGQFHHHLHRGDDHLPHRLHDTVRHNGQRRFRRPDRAGHRHRSRHPPPYRRVPTTRVARAACRSSPSRRSTPSA